MQQITVEEGAGAVVVSASGEVDAFVAPELGAALERGADRALVADLTAVSFLDSTVLGLLVRVVRSRDAIGARTRVLLPRGTGRRIFEITTLDRVLPVSASLEEALSELER